MPGPNPSPPPSGNNRLVALTAWTCAAVVLLSLSACKSTKPKSKPPTSPGGGVPLAGHTSNGLNLGLRDGSSWQVQPVGQGKVLRWLPGDPILVQRLPHPVFPFRLLNQRTQQATLARFTGRN